MAMNKVKVNNDVELKDRLVAINRVTKVTKGGRTFTFAAIVVVGDGNGVIGYGLGKAGEVTAAIAKGTEAAKKNLVKVPVLKGTVPHEVEVAFGGAKVLLKPAAAGTGLKAGGAMRAVLESVGVKDVIAKSKGSSNAHNLVKATIAALAQMRDAYTVAGGRVSRPLTSGLHTSRRTRRNCSGRRRSGGRRRTRSRSRRCTVPRGWNFPLSIFSMPMKASHRTAARCWTRIWRKNDVCSMWQ